MDLCHQNGFLSIRLTLSTNDPPFFFSGLGDGDGDGDDFGFGVAVPVGDGSGLGEADCTGDGLAFASAFVFVDKDGDRNTNQAAVVSSKAINTTALPKTTRAVLRRPTPISIRVIVDAPAVAADGPFAGFTTGG